MAKKSVDDFIDKTVKNIENDRAVASELLMQLVTKMGEANDRHVHRELGGVAAQYLETLQRSNEQLVKITALLQKREGGKENLSKDEIEGLFDEIKEQ
jgi:hypothetical protein